MEVCFGDILSDRFETAVALGNFDGLHIGHMAIIETVINESRSRGLTSTLYNFTEHPKNIFKKAPPTLMLTTAQKKMEILKDTCLDILYFDTFDKYYALQTPQRFIKNVLLARLGAKFVVVGEDYRFGHKAKGDIEMLKNLGEVHGFDVKVIPPVKLENKVVCSTYIRELIQKGLVKDATKHLGRFYSINGEVVRGKSIGRQLGYPTANIFPSDCIVLPKSGVYITKTAVDGMKYKSVTNIGIKSGFNNGMPVVETHIIDFRGNIYGIDIEIFFVERLRDEIVFGTMQDLRAQIEEDVKRTKNYFLQS